MADLRPWGGGRAVLRPGGGVRAMTFCEIVLDQLPHITKGERKALREELEGHLEDHAARLEARGVSAQEACARAEEAMGDPVEIGQALAKQYPRFWLWAYRLLTLILIAGCVLFLIRGPVYRLRVLQSNLAAREDPWGMDTVYHYQGDIVEDMDLRIELETDTLRIFRVGVNPERMTASVYTVNYDRDPWGLPAVIQADAVTVTTPSGWSGGFFSHVWEECPGAAFGRCLYIPLQPGDDHLTFRYDYFGVEATFELPLPEWEGEK